MQVRTAGRRSAGRGPCRCRAGLRLQQRQQERDEQELVRYRWHHQRVGDDQWVRRRYRCGRPGHLDRRPKAPVLKKFAPTSAANGIKVGVQPVATNLQRAYVTATDAGKGPDIVAGATDWIGNLVQNGAIEPLQLPPAKGNRSSPPRSTTSPTTARSTACPTRGEPRADQQHQLVRTPPKTIEQLETNGQAALKAGKVKEILDRPGDAARPAATPTTSSRCRLGRRLHVRGQGQRRLRRDRPPAGQAQRSRRTPSTGREGRTCSRRRSTTTTWSPGSPPATPPTCSPAPGPRPRSAPRCRLKYVRWSGFAGTARPFVGSQAFYVSAKSKNNAIARGVHAELPDQEGRRGGALQGQTRAAGPDRGSTTRKFRPTRTSTPSAAAPGWASRSRRSPPCPRCGRRSGVAESQRSEWAQRRPARSRRRPRRIEAAIAKGST